MMQNKIYKILKKIEKIENTWTCIVPDKIDPNGKIITTRQTHLHSVSPSIGQLLRFLVLASNSKKILELGCSAGYSTLWMSLAAKETGGYIYTTEILKEKISLAKKNFKVAGVNNITLIEGDIIQNLKRWSGGLFDFIFVDADKEKYLEYYNLVFPLLKKGGIIVVDNIISHKEFIRPFLNKINSDNKVISSLIKIDSGLLLIYKRYNLDYRKNVCVIILNKNGEILLVNKKRYDEWKFVQGGLENSESYERALKRELNEELNIIDYEIIGKGSHKNQYDWPENLQKERGFKGQIQNFYLIRLKKDTNIRLKDDELNKFKWVNPKDIHKYIKRDDIIGYYKELKKEFPNLL